MTSETEALCKRLEREASNHLTGIPGPRRVVGSQMLEAAAKLREMAGAMEEIAATQREQFHNPNDHGLWCINRARAALAGGSHD